MDVKVSTIFDISVIRLDGQFTEDFELMDLVKETPDESRKVLLNFEKIDYINSNCFRALARMHHALMAHGGEVRLCSLKHNVRQLFQMANLDSGYHIYSCEDEGVISFYNKLPDNQGFITEIVYSS